MKIYVLLLAFLTGCSEFINSDHQLRRIPLRAYQISDVQSVYDDSNEDLQSP